MKLTERKLEVLRLIVSGRSNGQIAVILGISINTVAVHRTSIMKKMGVHKTADFDRARNSKLIGAGLVDAESSTKF